MGLDKVTKQRATFLSTSDHIAIEFQRARSAFSRASIMSQTGQERTNSNPVSDVLAIIRGWSLALHLIPSLMLAYFMGQRALRISSPINLAGTLFVISYALVLFKFGSRFAGRLWCYGAVVHEVVAIILQMSFKPLDPLRVRLLEVRASSVLPCAAFVAGAITGVQPLPRRSLICFSLVIFMLRNVGLIIAYFRLADPLPLHCLMQTNLPFALGACFVLAIPSRWGPQALIDSLERLAIETSSRGRGEQRNAQTDLRQATPSSDGATSKQGVEQEPVDAPNPFPSRSATRRVNFAQDEAKKEAQRERVAQLNLLVNDTVQQMNYGTYAKVSDAKLQGDVVAPISTPLADAAPSIVRPARSPGLRLNLGEDCDRELRRLQRYEFESSLLADTFAEDAISAPLRASRVAPGELRIEDDCNLVGSGQFGTVHIGQWSRGGDLPPVRAAVKVMHRHRITRQTLELFKRCVEVELSVLPHPNLVRTFCWGVDAEKSRLMLAMELCLCGSMQRVLEVGETARWQWSTKVTISRQIADGLAHLHAHEPLVMHRDLKPANILFDAEHHCKICDLGASRFMDVDKTMSNGVGTPLFCAPEQLAHMRYDESIDIWSVGCVFACLVRDSPVPYAMGNAAEKEAEDDSQGLLSMIMRGERFPDVPSGTSLHDVILDDCCRFKAGQRISAKRLAEKLAVLDNHDKE